MGLRETIQGAVGAGFSALDNLAEDATYQPKSSEAFNPATSEVPEPDESAAVAIKAVFTSYSRKDMADSAIEPEDIKALVQASYFATEPEIGDRVIRSDGSDRRIVAFTIDPAGAMYTLQLRRAS